MKKLMIAAAIVCAAVASQAAQFDWSFEADDDMGSYGPVGASATYYLVSGGETIGATLANLLTTEGVDAFTAALGAYQNGTLSEGAASGRVTGVADADKYAAIFIFNDGAVGGKDFAYNVYDATENIYTPPAAADGLTAYASDWGDSDYAASWGTGTVKAAATPEPTSGLLLLLGVAGLALRRRRA